MDTSKYNVGCWRFIDFEGKRKLFKIYHLIFTNSRYLITNYAWPSLGTSWSSLHFNRFWSKDWRWRMGIMEKEGTNCI